MIAAALKRSKAFYEAAPVGGRPLQRHTHHPFEVFRKFGQGAGAAYLVFSGSGATLSSAAAQSAPLVDYASLDGLAAMLASGGFHGPLQILGAVILFLAAGRCIARFAGLLAVGAAFILHSQGVGLEDIGVFASDFAQRMSAAIDAFMTAEVA